MASKMTAEDKQWQAESDARTLVEAETIRTEKARLGAAVKEITKMNKVKEKEIKLAKKITKKPTTKPTKKPAKKPTKTARKPARKPMKTTRKATRRKR